MTTFDIWLLFFGKLALAGLAIFVTTLAVWFTALVWYKAYRNAIGIPILQAAIEEYKRTHPEAFEKFNKTKDTTLDVL